MAANGRPERVLRQPDDDVRAAARALIAGSRHAALASLEPGTGSPIATRVGLAVAADGTPLILVSGLAAHGAALAADRRCSLLVGEPGKGDPLAHPRITLACRAEPVGRDSRAHVEARTLYLAVHPKARLYVDLPDFRFFALDPQRARFNAGFGKAYALSRRDLIG